MLKPSAFTYLILVLLVGCVSVPNNYTPNQNQFSEPPLGIIAVAQVGDTLLSQGIRIDQEYLVIPQELKISGYTISKGIYAKHGQSKDGDFFRPDLLSSERGGVSNNVFTDLFQSINIPLSSDRICVITISNTKFCKKNSNWTTEKRPSFSAQSYQQHLLYSGRIGDKIRIGYRELSGDLARAAFNNEVDYDLGQSTTIGYKGARLEVLEATNEHIKYRVLSNFPKTQ